MLDSFRKSLVAIPGVPEDSTSTGLLDAARAEDPAAWERLVDLYGRLVLFWCRRSGLEEADRADVFQDVFRTVYCQLHQFRKERPQDSFRAWLRTVTRHKIIDYVRTQTRHVTAHGGSEAAVRMNELADPLTGPSSNEPEPGVERELLLRRALEIVRAEFEPRTWQAFWRTAADGIATDVVAQELGMSNVAVRKAKSRVFQRLRACFVDSEDLESLWSSQ